MSPATRRDRPKPEPDPRPERFVFLLLENFTLIAFAGAIEPLRIANRMAGRTLYEWRVVERDAAGRSPPRTASRSPADGGLAETGARRRRSSSSAGST